MKNTKYIPLITSFLFVLCFFSCDDKDEPLCCAGLPSTLSLHIADIEGVGTSEKARKDFLSKVSIYYPSKTGVKTHVPLTGSQDPTYTEFSEVKKLILIKNQNECEFNVENCLSLKLLRLDTFWSVDSRKKTKRLYLQIRQDVYAIDLTVNTPEYYSKYIVTNIQVNEKNMRPILSKSTSHNEFEYYFSKAGKKPKIVCPSD